MAFENIPRTVTFPAGADLSAAQYHFVVVNGSGQVVLAGDGADADGVLQDDDADAAGKETSVALISEGGITKVVAGGAISIGGDVAVNASGRAVAPVTGDAVLGIALQASVNNGDIISMLIKQKSGTS